VDRTWEGLFPADVLRSTADSALPPAPHPGGDFGTVGTAAAGHLQSRKARGASLVKKLKLFGEDWLCGLCFSFCRSSPHLPTLAWMGGSAEGRCTTGGKMGCLLNSTSSQLVLTATLANTMEKIPVMN